MTFSKPTPAQNELLLCKSTVLQKKRRGAQMGERGGVNIFLINNSLFSVNFLFFIKNIIPPFHHPLFTLKKMIA